jgi:hypothetical protein
LLKLSQLKGWKARWHLYKSVYPAGLSKFGSLSWAVLTVDEIKISLCFSHVSTSSTSYEGH